MPTTRGFNASGPTRGGSPPVSVVGLPISAGLRPTDSFNPPAAGSGPDQQQQQPGSRGGGSSVFGSGLSSYGSPGGGSSTTGAGRPAGGIAARPSGAGEARPGKP